jgi:hypothetical protein
VFRKIKTTHSNYFPEQHNWLVSVAGILEEFQPLNSAAHISSEVAVYTMESVPLPEQDSNNTLHLTFTSACAWPKLIQPFSSLSKQAKYWYLGITFDWKLVWIEHTNNIANKTLERISVLYPLLGYHSNLSPVLKLSTIHGMQTSHPLWLRSLGLRTQIRSPKTPDDAEHV